MPIHDIEWSTIKPPSELNDYVESFWFVRNRSDSDKKTIGLPDGRIDLSLLCSPITPFRVMLLGVGTRQYEQGIIPANSLMFAISFKLLAVEYIFNEPIADLVNNGKVLQAGFWDFNAEDLKDFDRFCDKASQKIHSLLPKEIDGRKQTLFQLIYATKGAITVKELAEKVFWNSRQINRYFNQQFGIPLKAYCNIIRFRASLEHIAKGKLFPEEDFFDQTHFIKEIKKMSGVVPKELFKNENDRFILLSALAPK